MGFEARVEGLDDLPQKLEEAMEAGLEAVFQAIRDWCEKIEYTARENCGDTTIRFYYEDSKIKTSDLSPKTIDCLMRAIRTHLLSMPDEFRPTFEHLIEFYESKKRETEKSPQP